MLSFFDAVASVAALVWALAVGACIFLAIDWDGLFEAKYIKVFLVVAIIAQATLFIIKKNWCCSVLRYVRQSYNFSSWND